MSRTKKTTTEERMERLSRVLEDNPHLIKSRWWRLNNLYTVRSKDSELVTFKPLVTQREIYQTMRPLEDDKVATDIYLKGRQIGCTTWWLIYGFDNILFNKNYRAAFIAQGEREMKENFRKVQTAWKYIPEVVKQMMGWEIKERRTDSFVFGHDSQIMCAVNTTGDTINFLHVAEYGVISDKYPHKAEDIRRGAFPSVSNGGRIVVESTNRGVGGDFVDLWNISYDDTEKVLAASPYDVTVEKFATYKADELERLHPGIYTYVHKRLKSFMPHFYTWWQDKGYRTAIMDGEKFELGLEERRRKRKVEEMYDYEIEDEQFNWYRYKKSNLAKSHLIKQELPDTIVDAFTSSDAHVFKGDVINKMVPRSPLQRLEPYDDVKIYVKPVKYYDYVISCDLSEGDGGDYQVVKVFCPQTGEECASWSDNMTDIAGAVKIAYELWEYYVSDLNEVVMAPEMNYGGGEFRTLMNQNIGFDQSSWYRRTIKDERKDKKTRKIGWKTTVNNKKTIIYHLERMIRKRKITLYDSGTLTELRYIVKKSSSVSDNYKIEAQSGHHDDRVMATAIGVYIMDKMSKESHKERMRNHQDSNRLVNTRSLYNINQIPW